MAGCAEGALFSLVLGASKFADTIIVIFYVMVT